ncbi:MAG: cytidine deaminase [Clostridia bacterium]|nr:cytidine deaminase [Clostridia bacterium]MBR2927149.1 cytidine deaminase [Clostridia bacterium]
MVNRETAEMLIEKALEARKKSYCPYSSFSVGAALLTSDGSCYTGANIECSSHTPTVCAERVAFFSAVHDGKRDFSAIAIVGGDSREDVSFHCPPCGVCRQVMSEFCKDDFSIILYDGKTVRTFTLGELLPMRFGLLDPEER